MSTSATSSISVIDHYRKEGDSFVNPDQRSCEALAQRVNEYTQPDQKSCQFRPQPLHKYIFSEVVFRTPGQWSECSKSIEEMIDRMKKHLNAKEEKELSYRFEKQLQELGLIGVDLEDGKEFSYIRGVNRFLLCIKNTSSQVYDRRTIYWLFVAMEMKCSQVNCENNYDKIKEFFKKMSSNDLQQESQLMTVNSEEAISNAQVTDREKRQCRSADFQDVNKNIAYGKELSLLIVIRRNTTILDGIRIVSWRQVASEFKSTIDFCKKAYLSIITDFVKRRISLAKSRISIRDAIQFYCFVTRFPTKNLEEISFETKFSLEWCNIVKDILFRNRSKNQT